MSARRIIGVAGCPGAGKSTLAASTVAAAQDTHVLVPMDGFHLSAADLKELGRADRKGAPDTFDVDGYVALLQRLRREIDRTIFAPEFNRSIEASVADAIAIEPQHTVIVTEGNYLLHDAGGWERVHPLLDECWYVEVDDSLRLERLVARHVEHGRSPEQAEAWVRNVDEPNARLIRSTRSRADRIIDVA